MYQIDKIYFLSCIIYWERTEIYATTHLQRE